MSREHLCTSYDGIHDISKEHKPLYGLGEEKAPFLERVKERMSRKQRVEVRETDATAPSP